MGQGSERLRRDLLGARVWLLEAVMHFGVGQYGRMDTTATHTPYASDGSNEEWAFLAP